MKLKEIGEFGFIERFKPTFEKLVHGNMLGIGDDCAIIPANDDEDWLVTTDLLIEDVHFLRNAITPEQLGHKALAVNLSDIAAMGGTPVGSFLSFAVPLDVDVEYLDRFVTGYYQISENYKTPLLGGDTTKSMKHMAINVCVIGKCPKGKALKRSTAKIGDAICVTGHLGDSGGGLQVVLDKLPGSTETDYLKDKHHMPEPRIEEGVFLSETGTVHAMMDISDGIASDLSHILRASGVSARVIIEQLPLSEQLKVVSKGHNFSATDLAIGAGEDYELLLTVESDRLEYLQRAYYEKFGKPLICIGSITEGAPVTHWFKGDTEVQPGKSGFNHFQ